jgi:hypothetical protein
MFKPILGALTAHKHIVIAAIAITGIGVYAFPYNALNLNQAQADHGFAANIDRDILIPCQPYCSFGGAQEPDDVIIGREDANPPAHIEIRFTFV